MTVTAESVNSSLAGWCHVSDKAAVELILAAPSLYPVVANGSQAEE